MKSVVSGAFGVLACAGLLSLAACENMTNVGGGSGGSGGNGAGGSATGGNGPGGSGPGPTSVGSTGSGDAGGGPQACQSQADKVDLLFVVDNSRSMADKQEVLSNTLADLVQSLTNPPCVDGNGIAVLNQPATGLDACPQGSARVYAAVNDIHIGVISSSLGGHGADACPQVDNNTCSPNVNTTNNDKGRLLDRADACTGGTVSTYNNFGFLKWDANQTGNPAGSNNMSAFINQFSDIVLGVGQIGCGYEAPLESWYRFLVDPEPYETLTIVNGKVTPQGIDNVVLAQRKQFLRPDSLLGVVVLSDENDCSIREEGQYYLAAQLKGGNGTPFRMPKARAVCAQNPDDPCCASCAQATPVGCQADPTCLDGNGGVKMLSEADDPINLRCFDQKRRFGIDFLYPTQRYADALTSPTITRRDGTLAPNPLFSDLIPEDANTTIRDAGQVVFTTIVGVPWQEIAIGGDPSNGFKPASQIDWNAIVGQPGSPPTSPYMIESIYPRPGIANPNVVNGHEFTILGGDDLQFACVYELQNPHECTDPSMVSCDCKDPSNDNPLCAPSPLGTGNTFQIRAKAYPGIRELQVAKATGGVVSSICPPQLDDPTEPDYGYRPAIRTLIDKMKPCLLPPAGL